jgi:general secretion pathway protein K
MARSRRGEHGIALLTVLWVVAALALIAAVFMQSGRTQVRLARNLVENAKAEALADAGVQRALYGLLAAGTDAAWRADGSSHDLKLFAGTVRITLQDEGGKIDLNRAGEDILVSLFSSVGIPAADAREIAAAVADYRDMDSDRRPNGAEDPDYARRKLPFGAKDALFARTDELRQAPGVTAKIFERVEPLVTVYSPRRYVDLASAPEAVLRALPYLTNQQRQDILVDRNSGAAALQSTAAVTVTITAEALTEGGGRFVREAVVHRSADPSKLFDVLSWRRRWSVDEVAEAGGP